MESKGSRGANGRRSLQLPPSQLGASSRAARALRPKMACTASCSLLTQFDRSTGPGRGPTMGKGVRMRHDRRERASARSSSRLAMLRGLRRR
eukprot:scaffold7376_cov250-Pinguiococcus_pyrenoidosus.AAC.11